MTARRIVLLAALMLGGFAVGAAPSCQRELNDAICPCTDGWTCCADGTCRPAGSGCEPGPALIDGGACIPPGHGVQLKSTAQLEALIGGDWLRCSGTAYPADYGIGLRISADHTWNALEETSAGVLEPITTGFDGYGMWRDFDQNDGRFQFDLLIPSMGGGEAFFLTFLDSGHMEMDAAGAGENVYRRPDVACPCPAASADGGTDDAGDAGPSGADAGDAIPTACRVPNGTIVPYATVAQLEALIEADWLRCSGTAYPAEFGVGLRISPDRTWNALEAGDAGGLMPITTGFDGYGTWFTLGSGSDLSDPIVFFLVTPAGLSGGLSGLTFTDTGQMQIGTFNPPMVYQRLPAGGP